MTTQKWKNKPMFGRIRTPIKMMILGTLTLLLLIPLGLVKGVLHERLQRRDAAVYELSATWGYRQEIAGPVLVVPCQYRTTFQRQIMVNGNTTFTDEVKTHTANAYFFPSSYSVKGTLDPHILYRGIYEAVVYQGALSISGSFDPPSFEDWSIAPDDVLWNDAYIAIGISDLRGAQKSLTFNWNNREIELVPATGTSELASGVRAHLKGTPRPTEATEFHMDVTLNGSAGIRIAPVGERNEIHLSSTWSDPSFQGAILPSQRTVSDEGFEATWKSSYYGRPYPQKWLSTGTTRITANDISASSYGVDLISMVDHYRLVERTIKYGILFIVLVFTAFFLFEMLTRIRIHPFQYTLVGFALCLFYLALLSLSEFISFGPAYAAGTAACTIMISLYCANVLRSGWNALMIAAKLSAIYAVLFVILRLQDYSLLLGTTGLFAALAIVMFATRKIDWYARDEEQDLT